MIPSAVRIQTTRRAVALALHDTSCCSSLMCRDWRSGRYGRWAEQFIDDLHDIDDTELESAA